MNNEFTIRIEPSIPWNNPYKNGCFRKINIEIINNTQNEISINSIDIVIGGNNYRIDKTLLASYIMPNTQQNIKENTVIFEQLRQRDCISDDFYLLIKHSAGESISNTINIFTKPTCVY